MIKKVDPIYHIRDDPNAETFQQPPHKQKRGILKKQQNITDLHSHGRLLIKKNTAITTASKPNHSYLLWQKK